MAKTERVELRIDEDLLARVDAWASENEDAPPSRSEALRQLIETGLEVVSGQMVHFTAGDKLNFMLLRDIAKSLKVRTETDLDFISGVMHGGHYWAPSWTMSGLFHPHADKRSDVTFVVDVLDMWNFIEEGVAKLTPKQRAELEKTVGSATFEGFDGNNEGELMSIAGFIVETMGRFGRFKGRGHLNSHFPVVTGYRRMLDIFKPMRAQLVGVPLDAGQLARILGARRA